MKKFYKVEQFNKFIVELERTDRTIKTYKKGRKKQIQMLNLVCAFDIETTSTIINDEKFAYMYIWQFAIFDFVFIGRTWNEFVRLIGLLQQQFNLSAKKRLIVYVHNLSFEFQFLKDMLQWNEMLCRSKRTPIFAICENGVEFRCSYMLTNTSLAKLVKDHNLKNKKLDSLVYSKIHNPNTPITFKELQYCVNDVLALTEYIEKIEIPVYKKLHSIPLTFTSKIKKQVKQYCLNSENGGNYRNFIKKLTMTAQEYTIAKKAFQGGHTHTNIKFIDKVVNNFNSYDICSSYPATFFEYQFPISSAEYFENENGLDIQFIKKSSKDFLFTCEIILKNVESRNIDNIIASSHCEYSTTYPLDNGKIVKAEIVKTWVTSVDLYSIFAFYKIGSWKITKMYRYKKGYMPKQFLECVLQQYENKTKLKDIEDKLQEYFLAKSCVNGLYGLMVQDPCRIEHYYDNNLKEWTSKEFIIEEKIEQYNTNKNRFNFYLWGVFCTAYARFNLYTAIFKANNDFIYCDTDSIKVKQPNTDFEQFIDFVNNDLTYKIKRCCEFYNLDFEKTQPKTIKGKVKKLGVWEFEGNFDGKFLGSKRYLLKDRKTNIYNSTVAGISKKAMNTKLLKYDEPFEKFENGLYFSENESSKNMHSYIDYEQRHKVTDYLGNTQEIFSKSGVYIGAIEFRMTRTPAFQMCINKYINEIEDIEII